MKLKNTILVQVTLYIVIFFHSLFIIIPLSIYSSQFNEHCLLYASGKWQFLANKSDPQILTVMWSDKSLCNYSTAVGFISLFVSLAYFVWFSTLLLRIHDQSRLDLLINLIVNATMSFFLLISSFTLTVGFHKWCELLEKNVSCSDAEFASFVIPEINNKTYYHLEFKMAQFGAWSCCISWLLLTIIDAFKMWYYCQPENFTSDHRLERHLEQHSSTSLL